MTTPPSAEAGTTRIARRAIGVFAAATLLRLGLAPAFDLMPQDAYYAIYAANPALSYFDHPPMIGYLILASLRLVGHGELGVRLGLVVATAVTSLAIFALGRRLFPGSRPWDLLALASTTGLATVVSLVGTPDTPLLCWWAVSLLLLHRALDGDPSRARDWLLAGGAMGLALLSKYTALFLPAGLGIYLVASRRHRHLLRTRGPWSAGIVALVMASPVVVWNARHDWASFRFQYGERTAELAFQPDRFLGFLAAQTALLLPVAFALVLWGAVRSAKRLWRRESFDRELFLLSFFAPLFLFCLGLSTVTWVKVNWPMPAYVTGLLLASYVVTSRRLALHLAISVAFHALLLVEIFAYPWPVETHDTWYRWSDVATAVESRAAEHRDAFVFSADSYKTTAELLFYTDLPAHGRNIVGCPALQLDYLGHDHHRLRGRPALLVRNEPDLEPSFRTEEILDRADLFFEEIRELSPVTVKEEGETVRLVRLFRAEGYRGPDAAAVADARAVDDPCRFEK